MKTLEKQLSECGNHAACQTVEEGIELGISIFDSMIRCGTKEGVTVYDGLALCELYGVWLKASGYWLSSGIKAAGADELQAKVWLVFSWLEHLRRLSDELTAVIEGRGIPLKSVLSGV